MTWCERDIILKHWVRSSKDFAHAFQTADPVLDTLEHHGTWAQTFRMAGPALLEYHGRIQLGSFEGKSLVDTADKVARPLWVFYFNIVETFERLIILLQRSCGASVDAMIHAAGTLNATIVEQLSRVTDAIGNAAVHRRTATGVSISGMTQRLVNRMLGGPFFWVADWLQKGRCNAHLHLQRTGNIWLVQLHAVVLHIGRFLNGVLADIPSMQFHGELGPVRTRVQAKLLDRLASPAAAGGVLRMVEIGVDTAEVIGGLLEQMPHVQYVGVDPYLPHDQQTRLQKYTTALMRLMCFPGRANLLRMTSADAAPWFRDGSLDLIFIDGRHDYAGVVEDLTVWLPKLRSGGIVAGHDYSASVPGVVDAVHDVFALRPPADRILHLSADYTFFWRVS